MNYECLYTVSHLMSAHNCVGRSSAYDQVIDLKKKEKNMVWLQSVLRIAYVTCILKLLVVLKGNEW